MPHNSGNKDKVPRRLAYVLYIRVGAHADVDPDARSTYMTKAFPTAACVTTHPYPACVPNYTLRSAAAPRSPVKHLTKHEPAPGPRPCQDPRQTGSRQGRSPRPSV